MNKKSHKEIENHVCYADSHSNSETHASTANGDRTTLKFTARLCYDYQKIRCASRNRIRNIIRTKYLGLPAYQTEQKMENKDKSYGKQYNDNQLKKLLLEAQQKRKISKQAIEDIEYLYSLADKSKETEEFYAKEMSTMITKEPIYDYLKQIKGISHILTANLLYFYGYCEKFETISKLWAYSGYAVKEGQIQQRHKGEKIAYNVDAKTLGFKIADCLIKVNGGYKKLYDKFKEEYIERFKTQGIDLKAKGVKGHIHAMARRKMIKVFLQHYWITARKIKELPVSQPYVFEHKEGHTHYIEPFTDVSPKTKKPSAD